MHPSIICVIMLGKNVGAASELRKSQPTGYRPDSHRVIGADLQALSQHPPIHTLFAQPPCTDLHGIVDGEDVLLGAAPACADHGANLAEAALAREDVHVGQTEGPQLPHSLMGRGGGGPVRIEAG